MIKITFPDASVREYEKGVTGLEIAQDISRRLAQDALAISVNGETWDLTRPIDNDSEVNILKWEDEEGKHAYWHS
ncbi:MAG: TGS domain-containing protein, partial [Fermentimonas sp.]|nr:TGS domain-containing protein [Fermentimonas sp.]